MLQITYISTARPELPAQAIDDILAASGRNNRANGVTGLLLYDGYRFLQALEGDPAAVMATFDRIKADPRHRAVVTLSRWEVSQRVFGDWAMAGQRVRVGGGSSVAEMVDQLTEEVVDPTMKALFRSFARVRNAA